MRGDSVPCTKHKTLTSNNSELELRMPRIEIETEELMHDGRMEDDDRGLMGNEAYR
jgi:hypothetical protein